MGNVTIPTDELIFFRGVGIPRNQRWIRIGMGIQWDYPLVMTNTTMENEPWYIMVLGDLPIPIMIFHIIAMSKFQRVDNVTYTIHIRHVL